MIVCSVIKLLSLKIISIWYLLKVLSINSKSYRPKSTLHFIPKALPIEIDK